MFEINPETLGTKTDKMLYNIMKHLEHIAAGSSPLPIENKKDEYPCKYCGGTHKVRQQIAVCAKKNKSKEV